MRKYLSLTRVLLKNSMGMMSDGKSKKALNVFIYGVLAVCMIPLGRREPFWHWAFTFPHW